MTEAQVRQYDVVVIGAGPGGYVAAIRASQLGKSVACVEKDALGGTCLNRGCIPTKTFLATSDLAAMIREGDALGISVSDMEIDMAAVQSRKNKVVTGLRTGVAGLLKKNKVTQITGTAKLVDRHTVEVASDQGTETLKAADIVLATGSSTARPKMFPFGDKVMTSDEVLALDSLPKHILIVGGGIIGAEFACFFRDMGCDVTIVEMLDRLVSVLDKDISKELANAFKKRKIKLHLSTRIEKLEAGKKGVKADMGKAGSVEADIALGMIIPARVFTRPKNRATCTAPIRVNVDGRIIAHTIPVRNAVPPYGRSFATAYPPATEIEMDNPVIPVATTMLFPIQRNRSTSSAFR